MYKRLLFSKQAPKTSCFIFGARQTGKTTLLDKVKSSLSYDLLERTLYLGLSRDPDIIYKECAALDPRQQHMVWIDEVQKIPALLDVVHRTIEKFKNINFILSGSSARKLRAQGVNLLGGRALDYKLHPLTSVELEGDFDLSRAVQYGTLPKICTLLKEGETGLAIEILNSYVALYLDEEIKREALVRNLEPFQRFIEVVAQSCGCLINFSKISDESLASRTAVINYFSILEDTLVGFFLPPYHQSVRKQLIKQPKFYLFDNGVTRAISNTLGAPVVGLEKGALFEQFVIQEVRRINDYYQKRFKLYFWRTEAGAEVDLLLCRENKIIIAIECKASPIIQGRDLSGLKTFKKDHPKVKTLICAPVERDQEIQPGYTAVSLERLVEIIIAA